MARERQGHLRTDKGNVSSRDAEVTPFNGRVEGAPFRSASVSVVNTAPIISDITIDVDHEAQGRQLLAKVDAVDPDNDPIAILYRWRKNGTVLKEGEEKRLEVAGLTAKDSIEVDVTASDGIPDGVTTVTQRFTLSNSAPMTMSSVRRMRTGTLSLTHLTCRLRAWPFMLRPATFTG
jgi:hypothetical protein